jgi:RNA polymerase sigma-70 factor (ECF subfamily)
MEADDILQEGFIKVFFNLKSYRGDGALEGWIRRTIVNTAINYYKKNLKYQNDLEIEKADTMHSTDNRILDTISANDLIKLIHELPVGYRMVFNLNVIEGYTHKEIAEILNISENTSKSQLSRARHSLQAKINELNITVY